MGCKATLGEICNRVCSGGTPKRKCTEYYDGGTIPWLNTKEIAFNRIYATESHITEEGLRNSAAKWINKDSVIIAMYGATAGKAALAMIPLTTNQACCNLEVNPAVADYRYVYYWIKNRYSFIANLANGGAQQNLSAKTIKALELNLPPLNLQHAVANVLAILDDKIELNNRLNGYLEELLFAKYDELFPAESEHDGTLADIGTVVGGATPSKKRAEYYCENGIGWITPRDLSNSSDKFIAQGAVDLTEEGYSSCSVKLLPAGSVLFSSRAPIGYVAIAAANVTTNQGFKSIVPKEEFGTAFVYCFLVRNKKKIADMGAGTTFPEVSGSMMRSVPLSLPSGQLCAEFSAFAHPILEQQRSLELENRSLCLLRDALLPKLMSGEIDVSKVDLTQPNSHLADC